MYIYLTKQKHYETQHNTTQHKGVRPLFFRSIFSIFLLFVFSCQTETEIIDPLANAHLDTDFISFYSKTISLHQNSILTFEKHDVNVQLLQESIQKSDVESIAKIFGFDNSTQLLNHGEEIRNHLQKFTLKFPDLMIDSFEIDNQKFREIIGRHQQIEGVGITHNLAPNGRIAVSFVCTRNYSDCRANASTDLSISTSQCLSYGAIVPGYYVLCQGVALLSYSFDMIDCNDSFTICTAAYS